MMFTHGKIMQNFMGLGGGNVELFVDGSIGAQPTRLPGNFGYYSVGPGLYQLIQ